MSTKFKLKRPGNGIKSSHFLVNKIHNIKEDSGDKSFVKVRVSPKDSETYHFVYAMVDTGNRACTLVSEKIFQKIYKNEELLPVPASNKKLQGAGTEHSLVTLGVPKTPLQLWFYNPDKNENRTIKFTVRPVVVRNLNLPFLLSYKDLKYLGAKVDTKNDILELPLNGQQICKCARSEMLLVPMRGNLLSNANVINHVGVSIEPRHEIVMPVKVKGGQQGAEVFIEPNEDFAAKTQLRMVSVVDRIRENNIVMMRI